MGQRRLPWPLLALTGLCLWSGGASVLPHENDPRQEGNVTLAALETTKIGPTSVAMNSRRLNDLKRRVANAFRQARKASHHVDYGGRHPFEILHQQRQEKRNDDEQQQQHGHRELQLDASEEYEPLRMTVNYDFLRPDVTVSSFMASKIKNELLPHAVGVWTNALRVFPAKEIVMTPEDCFGLGIDRTFTNTDLLIFAFANDPYLCTPGSGTIAVATACMVDQYRRPTVGVTFVCTGSLDMSSTSGQESAQSIMTHEVAHILGFGSDHFADFYDRLTGVPRTTTKVNETVECVNDRQISVFVPSEETVKTVYDGLGVAHHELVTPAVRNVVRNQFNCQTLEGALLENTPTNGEYDCFGSHWEMRLFATEVMAPAVQYSAISGGWHLKLSPLTLALFEDSGWYVVDYSAAESSSSSFGFGRGCDFVQEPCLVDGKVPKVGKGFYCSLPKKITSGLSLPTGCTPDRRKIGRCLIMNFGRDLPLEFQYFPDFPSYGGGSLWDYCPLYESTIRDLGGTQADFDCEDENFPSRFPQASYFFESFGPGARCIESDLPRPVCLKHRCNAQTNKVELTVREKTMVCNTQGEKIEFPSVTVKCPDFKELCPELVCPFNCAARGVCNFETYKCECFDPKDPSPFCANSPLTRIETKSPTVGPSPSPTTPPTHLPTTMIPTIFPSKPPSLAPVAAVATTVAVASSGAHVSVRMIFPSWTTRVAVASSFIILSAWFL